MGPREGRRVRVKERRQQDEREALGVQILRETLSRLSRRPDSERHSGTPRAARTRNREEDGNPALQEHPGRGGRQSKASTGDVHHVAEHRRGRDSRRETSEVIQIVRQEEDHVARMENAGVELYMMVESGQLKLAFPRRVPASPTVTLSGERCAYVGDMIFRVGPRSCERAEPGSRQ